MALVVSLAMLVLVGAVGMAGVLIPFGLGVRVAGGKGMDVWVFTASSGGTFDVAWMSHRHPLSTPNVCTSLPASKWWPQSLNITPGGQYDRGFFDFYPGSGLSLFRGFHSAHNSVSFGPHRWACEGASVPAWLPVLALAVVPTWVGLATVRARRGSSTDECTHCGYDLRASPDRCPECGAMRG